MKKFFPKYKVFLFDKIHDIWSVEKRILGIFYWNIAVGNKQTILGWLAAKNITGCVWKEN